MYNFRTQGMVMKQKKSISLASLLITTVSCFSLVASTVAPQLPSLIQPSEELTFNEYILPDEPHIIVDESYDESLEDPLDPPNDEDTTNVEEDYTNNNNQNTKMDVNKVLYDPNMNYGKGAPVPKPAPVSSVKRSVIVVAASVMFAALAVSLVAANKGHDAP